MNTPDWLTQHGGSLTLGSDKKTWYVVFSGKPQYALEPLPAKNQFNCMVRQTINGQRIASETIFPNGDDALRGGLEDLRQSLGW